MCIVKRVSYIILILCNREPSTNSPNHCKISVLVPVLVHLPHGAEMKNQFVVHCTSEITLMSKNKNNLSGGFVVPICRLYSSYNILFNNIVVTKHDFLLFLKTFLQKKNNIFCGYSKDVPYVPVVQGTQQAASSYVECTVLYSTTVVQYSSSYFLYLLYCSLQTTDYTQ